MSTATHPVSTTRAVETSLNYLGDVAEPLFTYAYEAPPGEPKTNVRMSRRPALIHDARALRPAPWVDREGFAMVNLRSAGSNFYDDDEVRRVYYPECARLMKQATGAVRVMVFDHIVRNTATGGAKGIKLPAAAVHNDYTSKSGPQRVRDLLPSEADALLKNRFAIINVWRPIRGPLVDAPLAICDARSIAPSDLVPSARIYPDRRGEIQAVRFNPNHRWYYYPELRADEAVLIKCYDSADDGRARFTAHTAFVDPTTPPGAPPRESIETRCLVFFAEPATSNS